MKRPDLLPTNSSTSDEKRLYPQTKVVYILLPLCVAIALTLWCFTLQTGSRVIAATSALPGWNSRAAALQQGWVKSNTYVTSDTNASIHGLVEPHYRQHLESDHAGFRYTLGSSLTSTFDRIYVLSVEGEKDRQEQMSKLSKALNLRFDIFKATWKEMPVVGWIAERVKEVRDKKRVILAKALGKKESKIGGMGADSPWFQFDDPAQGYIFPDLAAGDDEWQLDGVSTNWTTYLLSQVSQRNNSLLTPSRPDLNVSQILYDPRERAPFRQQSPGIIASYHSHVRMWKKMIDRNEKTALFLEDDVDIEWDFERIWLNALRILPDDWEMVLLGHCWGKTHDKPMFLNPIVREAAQPRCVHGYALSASGARHLLQLATSPWIAYQSAIDLLVARLSLEERIRAFVLEPPVIIQSKSFESSLREGSTGTLWKGLLQDSTLDRVMREEGLEVKPPTWEETKQDPAIWHS